MRSKVSLEYDCVLEYRTRSRNVLTGIPDSLERVLWEEGTGPCVFLNSLYDRRQVRVTVCLEDLGPDEIARQASERPRISTAVLVIVFFLIGFLLGAVLALMRN